MTQVNNIIIVTGGTLDEKILIRVLEQYEQPYIIGVDKGIDTLKKLDIQADLLIGDFDSASEDVRIYSRKQGNVIVLKPEKDYTDTHMAVLEALKQNPKEIILTGATGTRIDHVMANISVLKLCLEKGVKACIIDGNNRIRMIDKQCKIERKSMYGKYISCIPFSDRVTGINLIGFKYPLTDATMIKEDSIGISNELREEEGLIQIDTGYLLVMETKD